MGTIDAKAERESETCLSDENELGAIASVIRAELISVETMVAEQLSPRQPWLAPLTERLRPGGKRIRPMMALLFGHATGGIRPAHIQAAVAFELVHLATLVHDDILDGASTRRGLPAIHCEHGIQNAILAGDYLFTKAFALASCGECNSIAGELARASNEVCSGEIRQNHSAGDWDLGFAEYSEIVAAKTASLCASACRCGVLLNQGSEELAETAWRFGNHLGIAFQVIDDCLDLTGSEKEVGKTLRTDAICHKMTYPLIHALSANRPESKLLKTCLIARDDSSIDEIASLVVELGGVTAAEEFASDQLLCARKTLNAFPAGAARRSLDRLTEFVGRRRK